VTPLCTLRRALSNPKLLGNAPAGDSWQVWRVVLIAAMGEALTDDERVVFQRHRSAVPASARPRRARPRADRRPEPARRPRRFAFRGLLRCRPRAGRNPSPGCQQRYSVDSDANCSQAIAASKEFLRLDFWSGLSLRCHIPSC
jgi:hypothetical protein